MWILLFRGFCEQGFLIRFLQYIGRLRRHRRRFHIAFSWVLGIDIAKGTRKVIVLATRLACTAANTPWEMTVGSDSGEVLKIFWHGRLAACQASALSSHDTSLCPTLLLSTRPSPDCLDFRQQSIAASLPPQRPCWPTCSCGRSTACQRMQLRNMQHGKPSDAGLSFFFSTEDA